MSNPRNPTKRNPHTRRLAMKAAHYNALRDRVFGLLDKHPDVDVRALVATTRGRWDTYWAAGSFTNATEYHYLKDDHIDSALKEILKEYMDRPQRNPRGHYPVGRHFADTPGGIWHHGQRHASKEAAVRDLQYYLAQGLNARVARVSGKDIWQVWYLYDRR